MLTDELAYSIKGLFTFKIPQDHQLTKTVIKYNYILVCSFIEELDVINSYCKENVLIKDVMWSISPLVRAIKNYDGIKKGRNAFFAHYNRDKSNAFYPWWRSLYGVKLPRTVNEVVFLNGVVGSIRAILISQFINEIEDLKKKYKPEVDQYMEYIKVQEEIALQKFDDLNALIKEVDSRLTQKKIIIRKIM